VTVAAPLARLMFRGSAALPVPDFTPKPFRCTTAERDGAVHVRPEGELDISSVPILEECLRSSVDGGARRLVVDLRGLEFMDSTGLTLLTRWQRESRNDHFELALVRGDERIHRLFELTAMDSLFTFIDGPGG
jgi:anti-sigma B factor antagonist